MRSDAGEGRARRSFRLKVEFLEDVLRRGDSAEWIPRNLAELANWVDEERGFERWISFSVAAPNGPNSDLRRRLDHSLDLLKVRAGRPARKSQAVHASRQLAAEVRMLAQQNADLIMQLKSLEDRLRREGQANAILREREQELLTTLNGLLPLERQLRSIAPR